MPSTYTVNLGIEKPATGEQSGTWGDTTNVNFDILDQAVNGAARVTLTSAGSSGSPNTLAITNGATSDGRNKWVEFYSSGDLGGDVFVQLDPNDAEKIVFVRNSLASSRSILLFQGTYNSGRDLEIPAGVDMVVKFDGGGASAATVTDVYTKLRATEITTPTLTGGTVVASTSLNIAGDGATVTGIKDEDNMASNSATKLATQQSIKAYVDSQVGTVDTLAEILANGNTTGGTDIAVSTGDDITFADSSKAIFGAGSDLQIYHDGSNSYISDGGTGSLRLQGVDLQAESTNGDVYFTCVSDGAFSARHDGSTKLATTSTGIDVTGEITADGIALGDNQIATFGASNDLQIYHSGSHSYIAENGTGNLTVSAGNFYLNNAADTESMISAVNDGAVTLFYNNAAKLATSSTGIDVTGTAVTDGVTVGGTLDIEEVFEKVALASSTSGTINYDFLGQGVVFFSNNQTANRTINFIGDSGNTFNSILDIGQSATCSVLLAQGSTAYYLNAYQVDGSSVTPKWSGGSAPTEGNASGIDVYTFTIIKTANATFTVLASQTQFA